MRCVWDPYLLVPYLISHFHCTYWQRAKILFQSNIKSNCQRFIRILFDAFKWTIFWQCQYHRCMYYVQSTCQQRTSRTSWVVYPTSSTRYLLMERKGRPTLSESLIKHPIDVTQRALTFSVDIGLSPASAASLSKQSSSTTSTSKESTSAPDNFLSCFEDAP